MGHIEFTGRKPSKVQIMAKLKPLLKTNETFIQIQWGENWITLEHLASGWLGSGWIKGLSGDDLARELNSQFNAKQTLNKHFNDPVKFMREHFTIIHIS
jgi:hypothetical protein